MSTIFKRLIKEDYYNNWFTDIARELLTNNVLVISGNDYQIIEIEFYYHSKEHPDIYCHKSKEQLTNGGWYFHRIKSASKRFTLKGLDITFGNNRNYGGILIRAIKNLKTNSFIEGPSKTVDMILDENKRDNVLDMIGKDDYIDVFSYDKLYIKQMFNRNVKLFRSPRVGLKEKMSLFKDILYRYHANKSLATKGIN